MQFDNGEVLQGLDERWNFAGANAMEWACGIVVFMLIGSFAKTPGRAMPWMLLGWVFTTLSLASLRRSFPDEERGVRNLISTSCGFPPIGIPKPSRLQPFWSGGQMRSLPLESKFMMLGLDTLFPSFQRQLQDADS